MSVDMCIFVCVYLCVCVYIYMSVYVCGYVYLCVYISVCLCVPIQAQTSRLMIYPFLRMVLDHKASHSV